MSAITGCANESKVFEGASELQLDCMVEESSGGATVKHDGLLSLADLPSQTTSTPPHNGPSMTDMSASAGGTNDIKLDPAAGDTSASIDGQPVKRRRGARPKDAGQ
ncbi:hypothetical protein INR49_020013 [Caranx melampygus]|nr:hypothetical protein INR49_020013 [Caranx melampygus]